MAPMRIAALKRLKVAHQSLHSGNRCPDCGRGNVYEQKEPKALVRIVRSGAAGRYGL